MFLPLDSGVERLYVNRARGTLAIGLNFVKLKAGVLRLTRLGSQ